MDSPVKIMANNVYDRISKEAEVKQFRCKNAEEWYFTCSIFFEYVMARTNYSKKLIAGKRCELTRLATQKKEDLVRQKMLNLFQKEYINGIDEKYQTDLVDGVFLAFVSYRFEKNEKYFDGSAAFNYGSASSHEWWKTEE